GPRPPVRRLGRRPAERRRRPDDGDARHEPVVRGPRVRRRRPRRADREHRRRPPRRLERRVQQLPRPVLAVRRADGQPRAGAGAPGATAEYSATDGRRSVAGTTLLNTSGFAFVLLDLSRFADGDVAVTATVGNRTATAHFRLDTVVPATASVTLPAWVSASA